MNLISRIEKKTPAKPEKKGSSSFFYAVVILIPALLLVVTLLLFHQSTKSKKAIRNDDSPAVASTSHSPPDSNPVDNAQKFRAMYENMSRSFARNVSENVSETLDAKELTALKLSKRAIRDRVVNANYSEMAPSAMEELVNETDVDQEWTVEVKDVLTERLKSLEDKDNKLILVDCHQTICKIVTQHANRETARRVFYRGDLTLPEQGSGSRLSRTLDDGRTESTFYMGNFFTTQSFHEAVRNRIYENVTGTEVDTIEPTMEEIADMASLIDDIESGKFDK